MEPVSGSSDGFGAGLACAVRSTIASAKSGDPTQRIATFPSVMDASLRRFAGLFGGASARTASTSGTAERFNWNDPSCAFLLVLVDLPALISVLGTRLIQ